MHHPAHICLVDAHPKGNGTDNYVGAALQQRTALFCTMQQMRAMPKALQHRTGDRHLLLCTTHWHGVHRHQAD